MKHHIVFIVVLLQTCSPLCNSTFSSASEWQTLFPQAESSSSHPSVRYGHSSVMYRDSMILSHGYYYKNGMNMQKDTWSFNPSTNMWLLLNSGDQGPAARFGHTAVVLDNSMYMFGGETDARYTSRDDDHTQNDMWQLDLSQQSNSWLGSGQAEWSRVDSSNNISPTPRACHAHVVIGRQMCVYGGMHNPGDIWCFHLDKRKWHEIKPSAESIQSPFGQNHLGMVAESHPYTPGFVVYGGVGHRNGEFVKFSELWMFDILALEWRQLQGLPSTLARNHAASVLVSTNSLVKDSNTSLNSIQDADAPVPSNFLEQVFFIVFGGTLCNTRCICHQDLQSYSFQTNQWTEIPQVDRIYGRYRHTIVFDVAHSQLLTFGGESMHPYMYHNSVSALILEENQSHRAIGEPSFNFAASVSIEPTERMDKRLRLQDWLAPSVSNSYQTTDPCFRFNTISSSIKCNWLVFLFIVIVLVSAGLRLKRLRTAQRIRESQKLP